MRRAHRVPPAALAGLLAGAIAVGVGSLVAGIIEVRTPIDAVGTQVIDHAPVWLIDLGKRRVRHRRQGGTARRHLP